MNKPTVDERLALANKCATLLYAMDARHVWLFGALAMGCSPDEESDLDLVVDGLTPQQLYRSAKELGQVCNCKVDLVDMKTVRLSGGLRPHVLRTRILLAREP
jgi:predicted nucleotidyltransferase